MQVDIAAEVSDEIQKNLANQQQAEVQAEIDNQRKVSFQSSMKVAASFEPNKFAQALQLERKSGVPARVAYDNWGQIEQIKQQDKLDGLFSTAPRTADALSNPANAIVAKGDEDNLRNMELAVEKADFYQQGFFERQLAGPIRKWWDQDTLADTPGRLMQLDRITADFDRVEAGDDFQSPWANEYRNADPAGRKVMRDNANLQRNVALDKARVAQFDLEKAPVDPGDRAFQEAEGVTGALGAIADDPMWLGRVAAQSLPDMAQSLAAGLLNPILGGATEGATAANYKFLEVLQEKGIDPGDPVQLLQALRNDDLLSEASTRSARYGAGIGAVSIASFGLLGRVLAPSSVGGKPISQGAREWINAGVQVPVQGGLEALGELTGQVAERGQLSDVDGKEIALEGIVGALMAGPEAGVFAGKRFTNHMIQARRAERAAKLQGELVGMALESSTRKNDPASAEAIYSTHLAGQPNEFIEIPAAKLQELNQSGMVNIPELLENVGIDPNHFTAQVELGGTIRMKNSSYLAYLSEHDELLASSIRVASNDYSLDDVQELDRQMVADMEKVVAQFGETDQMASAYSDVMGQLLSSGYERGAADTTARQYAAVMTRLAQQTGQTVEDVMTANPLNIAREIPQQVRRIRGDDLTLMLGRLRAGDVPQSADMFGKSLRDYLASAGGLDDTGGDLASFDADAGRVGRNRLARPGGQSMDAAAMAAWERGYFPGVAREDVTPNLLIDALREEAAGTPRFSAEQENATLRDQAANLEALQEVLDREGVDLATATDDEIRALLNGERPAGQTLEQARKAQTDSPEFKAWFGGSKVVDTDGKPLVVYHGSDTNITEFDPNKTQDGNLWFSSDRNKIESGEAGAAGTSNIIPVYLRADKLAGWDEYERLTIDQIIAEGYDGIQLDDDYIVFSPEQIKSAVGNRGTFDPADPNILNQSQQASQELGEKNLILAHNLSADNLRAALDLGGLPAPSLAITRADAPIQGFGEITLIGDAAMAMPSAKNPVFDADVYSPRFPEVKVKVDEPRVRGALSALEQAADAAGIGARVVDRIVEELQRNRLGNAVAAVVYDPGLRYGYLTQVKGEAFDIPMKAQAVARQEANPRSSLIATEPLARVLAGVDVGRVEWNGADSAKIAEALYFAMINKFKAEAVEAGRENPEADSFTLANRRINIFADVDEANPDAFEIYPGVIYNPPKLMKPNGLKLIADMLANTPAGDAQAAAAPQMVIDRVELDRQLSERVDADEIRAWAREQFTPAMGERRIVKDNGRTADYSLDNIVKEMTRKVRDSEGFNYGLGNARSRGATKFKSLQQIQGQRDRVQSKADTDAAIEQNKKLYDELLEKLKPYHPGRGRGYGRSAWEALPDVIGESYTIGIDKALAENEFTGVPADLVEQVKEFASELVQLPTEYFEAKPQRAVMLSEFSGAVVPAGTSPELIAALEGEGLQVSEYAAGDEAARAQAVQQSATALNEERGTTLFQSQPNQQTETEAFKRWFGDSKVVDADGKPLVVYHGTAVDFDAFDNKKTGANDRGLWGRGHYFSASVDNANSYALRQGDGARLIPAYVSIKNPLVLTTGSDLVTRLPDGRNYRELVGQNLDGAKIKEIALADGHDGVIQIRPNGAIGDLVAYSPEQIKSAIGNSGAFDPDSQNILEQSGDDNARGSITFGPRRDGVRRFDIRLGKKSDLSTVLHEMGHYYLEVIGDLVADGKANESLAADYGVILGWLGAEPGKMITVDQHEQFARGFEKYLAEGKAPSIELQGAFSRFKRWLTGIYRDLRALNVELSPEVRGVFDRLLASEDAITEAQEALALSEQYESSITALMTPAELANYRRASQQARDEATTEIEQEILRAEIRKDQEWYREQKRAVEREVRDELEASQPYQARKWLFGNAPYPGLGKPLRLDSAAVTELFGSKSKEARFLGRARVREGGVHPEIAASMLGYINPSEMLNDMRAVPGLAEAIKIETERRMAERYPDPRVDGTLAEKAMAVVGEREAEVQAIQLRALAREAGRKASQHRIIKEAARQHIARLKLRDVIPYTFQRASTKAAKAVEAALLDGNMPKAYEEKEKQLMNLHLYREAVKAQDLAQKKRDQAKTYMKAGAKRKRLQSASVENYELAYPDGRVEYAATKAAANQAEADGAVVTPLFNFLEQVDGLLTKYEFGTPRRAIRQQREALMAFLQSMQGEHIVVNPPEWLLLDRAERTNWKDLTIDELVDVVDMIRQIDQMAKNKLQVLKGDAWAEFEPLRDAIVATVELNASKARNSAFNKSFADEIRRWGREWLGTLPADQIARELDGQDELGPVQENITTPVQLAGRNALIREKAEHQGLADLIRQFYTDDQIKGMNDASKLIAIPEIGDSMTRMQMVMLMANMGNEGNRQALLSEARGIWTAETIQAVMAKLDSNDADFVEALWSWIDKFWPEVSENEARRTGVAPAKVQGTPYPVKLADGKIRVLKGGYFPLKYDGDLSIKTSQDEVANAFKNMTAGRTAKAYTPEGHKIERVGSGGRPVKLSFGVVTSHLNEVVRDIVMTDPVNQAWRFLHDRDVQSAFEKSNLKELFTALEIWMQDTAEGEVVDSSYTTAAARWLRTGFTANVMLFNLSNSLLNLAGTHPLVVLGKRWAFRGYRDAFAPANWNQMYELSTFMREARIDTFNKDLTLVQDQMAGKGGWRAAMTTAGFYLHNKLQMFMDAVTWMGAYQKGMSMDLVGADLVTYADQRVVEASGSGVFADRSSLERGTLSRQTRQNELVRVLTTLAGYMIRKMAIARRRTAETSFKDIGQAMNWAVDMALLFTVEGLMFALVKGNIPDDEDEDQAVEWTKTAAWETAASIGGGLPPFGRPIVAGIQGFGGGSSSIDIFAEQFGNAVTQAKQGDADVTALKSVVALVGTATKTPGIATNRVIDWLDRAGEGETPPWYELFTGNRDK